MFNEAGKNVSADPRVDRPSAVDTDANPGPLHAIALQTLALALVARLSLDGDRSPASPEEQFLSNHFSRLQDRAHQGSWQALLLRLVDRPAPRDKALVNLAKILDLTPVELLSAALALAVEEDPLVGRSLAHVQAPLGGSRPTLSLLDAAFAPLADSAQTTPGQRVWSAGQIAAGRAVQTGLITLFNEKAPLPEQMIQIPTALVLAIRGQRFTWAGAQLGLPQPSVALPRSILEIAERHAAALARTRNRALVIRTASMQEGRAVAAAIATMLQMMPFFMDLKDQHPAGLGPLCLMKSLIPVFACESEPGKHRIVPPIPGYQGPVLMLSGPDGTLELEPGSTMSWSVPLPRQEERLELWQGYLADSDLSTELAGDHLHSAGRIAELARLSLREAELNRRRQPLREDIRKAAWMSDGGGLGALAQPVQTDVPDNALVLRSQTRQDLLLLIQRCRGRETLGENLGVTVKTSYQVGVRALFTGPSGTGKTLASGWLATHLSLPLYRVDLASVTSKYIGETEKNLAKLLAKAEQDEVVLLFDEADALFGKRTEVKDANDRFANAQTNYLLQRIESYKGIVLLTSNSRARFDPAFTRRLDMIIDFPAPGPEERRTLWQVHLGTSHQLSTRQLNQLAASCDLCGGHIRNATLTAAVKAQEQRRTIEFTDIIEGLTGEYKKLGRQMPVELKSKIGSAKHRLA
jgi:hypothetical protein